MVTHVVLLAVRANLTAAERAAFVASLKNALQYIPSVRDVRIGRRVMHGAGYEALPQEPVEFVALLDFDDLVGLQAYLRHPAHQELGARLYQASAATRIYDFDVAGMAELDRLLDE